MNNWTMTNVVAASDLNVNIDMNILCKLISSFEMSRHMPCIIWQHKKIMGTALVFSSGYISVHGKMDVQQARRSVRQYGRILQKKGFDIRIKQIKILTISGVHRLETNPTDLSQLVNSIKNSHYEPEIFPAVIICQSGIKALVYASGVVCLTGIKHCSKSFNSVHKLLASIRRSLHVSRCI